MKDYLEIIKDLWNPQNASKVRMAIHNALVKAYEDVDDNIKRQDELDDRFQNVLDTTTDEDVVSAPEIRDARNGKPNLKARLDDENENLNRQLAHIVINATKPPIPLKAAIGDGETDDTLAINNLLDYCADNGFSELFIPAGVFMIDATKPSQNLEASGGIKLRSNVDIKMAKGTILKAIPNGDRYYDIISGREVENVSITNGCVEGDRGEHTGTEGEWGHGIKLIGTKNIKIDNVFVSNCWGDGLYLGRSNFEKRFCENTTILNSVFDNNRRQGISVISVKGLYGRNVTVSNTHGTAPEAGIDFEPNRGDEFMEGIQFDNLKSLYNGRSGITIYVLRFEESDEPKNISMIFNNYYSEGDDTGVYVERLNQECSGAITFNNPVIRNAKKRSFYFRSWSSKASKIIVNNPEVVNNNVDRVNSTTENNPFVLLRPDSDYVDFPDFMSGNIEINNPNIYRDDGLSEIGYPISFQDNFKGVQTNEKAFDNITLKDVPNDIFGHLLLTNSTIDPKDNKIEPLNSEPVTLPNYNKHVKTYRLARWLSRDAIVTLSNRQTDIDEITFRYDTVINGAGLSQYIRPPHDERLYPLQYSTANGKGLVMRSSVNPTGSKVTLKRVDSQWFITDIIGQWEVED